MIIFFSLSLYFALVQMSNFEERLNILRKKKLTAKTIVEQQRRELRLWKCSWTLNERLEEIFRRFTDRTQINEQLYREILRKETRDRSCSNEQLQHAIEDLSKLIEQILTLLSIDQHLNLPNNDFHVILQKHKEFFRLIKHKLSDMYAQRIADEVSCITS